MTVVATPPVAPAWHFVVRGHPVTQGSKRAFVVGQRAVLVESGGERLGSWREAIAYTARAVRGQAEPLVGPVVVELHFEIQKPASCPKRRRTWPIKRRSGDLDKLERAALDAMTGVLFLDDSQVVDMHSKKDWAAASGPGVQVWVYEPLTESTTNT